MRDPIIGAKIGSYKLMQEIGEGGFGTVYVAQQSQPVGRKVALKIVKPGMDSKEVIARFEAERQALAMMDHPNVAKVLDGGTTELGRLYFAMELVHGTPITKFCDENRLSNPERLQIFIDVCRAVQHAHLKGIIHRDLKPSNVLVTMDDDKPMPKVIDFGVSKALSQPLTEKTIFTAYGQMVGTPLYMSPEQTQLSAQDVDVRSDVYSLGVLLYELLTGQTPFDRETLKNSGLDEIRRMIREVDPPRPSACVDTLRAEMISTVADRRRVDGRRLRQSLQGELDWIVMKALEKDRARRYESARDFAADIQRFLDGDAVEACSPSFGYRFKKQAQRHKGVLATLGVIAVGLMLATGVSLTFAFQAAAAQKQAEAEQQKALLAQEQSAKHFEAALAAIVKLLDHASSPALQEVPQSQLIRRNMIEDALVFYEAAVKQLGDNQELHHQAAKAWLKLAEVALSLNDVDQARNAYERSLTLVDSLIKQAPDHWAYRSTKIAILHDKGYFHLWERHEFDESRNCFQDALAEVRDAKLGRNQGRFVKASDLDLTINEINKLMGLANLARATGNWQERRRFVTEAYRLANEPSCDWQPTRMHLEAEMALIKEKEDPEAAAQHFKNAIQGFGEIVEDDANQQNQRYLFDTLNNAARFFRSRDHALAEQYVSRALDIVEQQANRFPEGVEYWARLWDYIKPYIGIVEDTLSDAELAAKFEKYEKYLSREPENYYFYKHRISAQFRLGNYGQALADMKKAIEINPEWAGLMNQPSPIGIAACPDGEFRTGVLELADGAVRAKPTSCGARGQRASLQLAMGQSEEARDDLGFIFVQGDFDDSLGHVIALVALAGDDLEEYRQACQGMLVHFADSTAPKIQFRVAWTCVLSRDALADVQPAVNLAEQAVQSSPENPKYLGCLGAILFRSGQLQAAEKRLREALQKTTDPNGNAAYDHYFLAMTLHELGNQDAATEALKTANRLAESELSEFLPWNRKLTLAVLKSEAEALIGQ